MSAESKTQQAIELPGLTNTRLDLISAEVYIGQGSPAIEQPRLTIVGEDDAFGYAYSNDELRIVEKKESEDGRLSIVGPGGLSKHGPNVRSGRSLYVIGGVLRYDGLTLPQDAPLPKRFTRRTALIELPKYYDSSFEINNEAGDVSLGGVHTARLEVNTAAGGIALRSVIGWQIDLNTLAGPIIVKASESDAQVHAKTVSGRIKIDSSDAPSWDLATISGDMLVSRTIGEIAHSSVSGRLRTSDKDGLEIMPQRFNINYSESTRSYS